ncbi:N-acetylneuraminate synthase family protein [Chloroflexota bacterium]
MNNVKRIKIGNRFIGENEPIFIIADAGNNHNGDFEVAKQMVQVASEIGADAVNFQTFSLDAFCTKEYSLYNLFKKLVFSEQQWEELSDYARKIGIIFFSNPLDTVGVDLLMRLHVPLLKVVSGDLTEPSLLSHIGETKIPIILSTGMANLGEVEQAIDIIKATGNDDIIVLHCVSNYPATLEEQNIRTLNTLRKAFQLPVGFVDHTDGLLASVCAAASGAVVIEKHFTLNKKVEAPDYEVSLEPDEMRALIENIRSIEKLLGSPSKRPTKSEINKRGLIRKSIVAAHRIPAGSEISKANLAFKRTIPGLSPIEASNIIGKVAKLDIKKDEVISVDKLY